MTHQGSTRKLDSFDRMEWARIYDEDVVRLLIAEGQYDDALQILCSFERLMKRLQRSQIGDAEIVGLVDAVDAVASNWLEITNALVKLPEEYVIWHDFWLSRAHVLRRGSSSWPSHKILLQLAAEQEADSPVAKAAEAWLKQGNCNWPWLVDASRMPDPRNDRLVATLEGHRTGVMGCRLTADKEIMTWGCDGTVRYWHRDGTPRQTVDAHSGPIGLYACPFTDRFVTWRSDFLREHTDYSVKIWNES